MTYDVFGGTLNLAQLLRQTDGRTDERTVIYTALG